MKIQVKYLILLLCIGLSSYSYAQIRVSNYSAVTNTANSPAFLDASSSAAYNSSGSNGKGLLFPRVDLSVFTFPSITAGVPSNYPTRFDGMIVYNTAAAGTAAAGSTKGTLTPGFWYYENKTNSLTGGTWKPVGGTASSVTSGVSGLSFGQDAAAPVLSISGSPGAGQFLSSDGSWKTPAGAAYTADESSLTLTGTVFSVNNQGITSMKIADNAVDSSKIKDGSISFDDLRRGDTKGQIIQWDGTRWVLAATASVIKKLTIDINTTNTIKSVFWQGMTGSSANSIEVVGIEPVIVSPDGDVFINENLTVSTTAKVVSNAIAYTLKVRNENINSSKEFTVNSINIYYICNDALASGNTLTTGTLAGQ